MHPGDAGWRGHWKAVRQLLKKLHVGVPVIQQFRFRVYTQKIENRLKQMLVRQCAQQPDVHHQTGKQDVVEHYSATKRESSIDTCYNVETCSVKEARLTESPVL